MTMKIQTVDPRVSESDNHVDNPPSLGVWLGEDTNFSPLDSNAVSRVVRQATSVVFDPVSRRVGLAGNGEIRSGELEPSSARQAPDSRTEYPLLGALPAMYPEWLGDRGFQETHGVRFAYMGGAMARGIASSKLVIALAKMGALGMFGSAGLSPKVVEEAITEIADVLDPLGLPWGSNLIHSPNEPALEDSIIDLYLRRGVRRVSASAYMSLTPSIVRYACTGLTRNEDGSVVRLNHVFAKISREEVASHFIMPAPQKILDQLLAEQKITAEEAEIAASIPLAEDIIVESDSGGHTDNRPLNALFPAIMSLRDRLSREYAYDRPIRLGAAGSLGTPISVAAAYALGAAFVLVGTVHQCAIESGVSDSSRALLAQAQIADVAMTASADMFELGVKVQVLQRGTMMAVRGNQLYDLYTRYDSLEDIPADIRANIEKNIFRQSLDNIWKSTVEFWTRTEPKQIEKANKSPKLKMALIFRWYIGSSSQWPIMGDESRQVDYQLWCGPAMGAFNRWVKGSFLETPENRTIQQIAMNLLEGAAHVTRAQQLRTFGLALTQDALEFTPTQMRT